MSDGLDKQRLIMGKKKITIIAAHDRGKTTVAEQAIKCGLSVVVKSGCRYCGGHNILSFDNDKYCKDCDTML